MSEVADLQSSLIQRHYNILAKRINGEISQTVKTQLLALAHIKAFSEARSIAKTADKTSLLLLWEIHKKGYYHYTETDNISDFLMNELEEMRTAPPSVSSDMTFIVEELFPALENLSKSNPAYKSWHPKKIVENDGAYSRMRASVSFLRSIVGHQKALEKYLEETTAKSEKKIARLEFQLAREDNEETAETIKRNIEQERQQASKKLIEIMEEQQIAQKKVEDGFIKAASLIASPNVPAESGPNSVRKQLRNDLSGAIHYGYYCNAPQGKVLIAFEVPENVIPYIQGLLSTSVSLSHSNAEPIKDLIRKVK